MTERVCLFPAPSDPVEDWVELARRHFNLEYFRHYLTGEGDADYGRLSAAPEREHRRT
jgi:hypothetical protein